MAVPAVALVTASRADEGVAAEAVIRVAALVDHAAAVVDGAVVDGAARARKAAHLLHLHRRPQPLAIRRAFSR